LLFRGLDYNVAVAYAERVSVFRPPQWRSREGLRVQTPTGHRKKSVQKL